VATIAHHYGFRLGVATIRQLQVPRKPLSPSVKREVLAEAAYRCANPRCTNVLTLQIHHMVWVKDDGGNDTSNLVALCGYCHDMHTQGHIPS
jgi:5-methylcytosine-specific restriction endonuclease McrA